MKDDIAVAHRGAHALDIPHISEHDLDVPEDRLVERPQHPEIAPGVVVEQRPHARSLAREGLHQVASDEPACARHEDPLSHHARVS